MRKQKKPSWLGWLAQVFKVTGVVTIVSFAVGWGGLILWSCFSRPSVPPQNPPRMYSTVESPAEADSPAETTKEAGSDDDCTSVIAGSHTTNLIEATPKTELPTLTSGESSVSLLESPSSGAASEPTVGSQATTSLVAISEFTPASVSAGSETRGHSSESTEQAQEMPRIAENDTKPESRRTLRLELSEEEKQKNAVLRQSISYKESRIRATKLLIRKSNSITYKRQVEWNTILTELSGIRDIRAQQAFKELERSTVRVLAQEQVRRTKYRVQIGLLAYQIQKDKKNIRELVAIPEEPEETSNC